MEVNLDEEQAWQELERAQAKTQGAVVDEHRFDNFPKELARVSDMKNLFSETKFRTPLTPVGWWVIGVGFQVALYEKPTDEHVKNHEELLGWKWRNAE